MARIRASLHYLFTSSKTQCNCWVDFYKSLKPLCDRIPISVEQKSQPRSSANATGGKQSVFARLLSLLASSRCPGKRGVVVKWCPETAASAVTCKFAL